MTILVILWLIGALLTGYFAYQKGRYSADYYSVANGILEVAIKLIGYALVSVFMIFWLWAVNGISNFLIAVNELDFKELYIKKRVQIELLDKEVQERIKQDVKKTY